MDSLGNRPFADLVCSPDAPFAGTDYTTDWRVGNDGTSSATGSSVVGLRLIRASSVGNRQNDYGH
jgi:hypothetical protein